MFIDPTSLGMRLPIGLDRILLGALAALPLLLSMLAAEVPLNGSDVAEPPRWGVVHARRLRTDVYALPRLLRARHLLMMMTMLLLLLLFISVITILLRLQSPLGEAVVAPEMELEVLTARKGLAADFTGELVRCRERVGGQRDHLDRFGVCIVGERDLITLKSKEIHIFISTLCLGFFSFELILIPGVSGRIRFLGIILRGK